MRIGVLTGGGDCPGLNAVIRAIVRKGEAHYGNEFLGFRHGWRGVVEHDVMPLTIATTRGILPRGGTILGTSRTNPFSTEGDGEALLRTLDAEQIDALVAIGGEDTLGVAAKLASRDVRVVGVPKTIDNDLAATDYTFGFNTAVQIASDAIDRLQTTAESHHRVVVVEVMGRHAGWIALHAGIAGGADIILVPEQPFDIEAISELLRRRHAGGVGYSIVVVAEGATPIEGTMMMQEAEVDEFGHVRLGGVSTPLAVAIESRTGFETRVVVLGHLLRGGTPTAFDRILATRFGLAAVDAVNERKFGTMVALRGTDIVGVPIDDAVRQLKLVPPERLREAEVFFG